MPSLKNYIFDAVYRWAIDAGYTPQVIIDTKISGVHLPGQFSDQDSITLNISPGAANQFRLEENNWIFFSATFSGKSYNIEFPLQAVQAIYARETGKGISFTGSQWSDPDGTPPDKNLANKKKTEKPAKPALKIVK